MYNLVCIHMSRLRLCAGTVGTQYPTLEAPGAIHLFRMFICGRINILTAEGVGGGIKVVRAAGMCVRKILRLGHVLYMLDATALIFSYGFRINYFVETVGWGLLVFSFPVV